MPEAPDPEQLGIGDTKTAAQLGVVCDEIHRNFGHIIVDAKVNNDHDGAAHISMTINAPNIPERLHEYLVNGGLVVMDPCAEDYNGVTRLSVKIVPLDIYETMVEWQKD